VALLKIERAQAQKAQTLASEIRNQADLIQAGDDSTTLKAIGFYGPLLHGPGVEASPEDVTSCTAVKPHADLSTWLEAINLASFADAFREQGTKTHSIPALVCPVCCACAQCAMR
jgi:hypothetical protein